MPTYICMLRGINVSAQKKIIMKELKALFEEAGYKNVRTYIQSGNVIFETGKKRNSLLEQEIETLIHGHYQFEVPTIVLTPDEVQKAIEENPFLKEKAFDEGKMYLCFLKEAPSKELSEKIKDTKYEEDRFVIAGKTIYLFVPGGYGNTKLNNNFFESKLKVIGTTRNWNTVNKLVKMAGA